MMSTHQRLFTAVAAWLASVAASCAPAESANVDPAVQQAAMRPIIRDSSGVRIVEYPNLGPASASLVNRTPNPLQLQLDQVPSALRLSPAPFLDIGGLQSDQSQEFDSRNPSLSTVTLSTGVIVAKDFRRLMYYSPEGRLLRTAGREGRGPGEFMQTRDLCLVSRDRVVVTDYAGHRIAVLDSAGQLLRAVTRLGDMPEGGCTTDGAFVIRDPSENTAISDTLDRLVPHRIVTLEGETVTSIGLLPAKSAGMWAPIPYVVVYEDDVFVGNGRTFEIKVFDRTGRLKRVTRLLRHLPPVSDQEWKVRLTQQTPQGTPDAIARFWRNMSMHRPYRDPAFSQIRVDHAKRLWVSDFLTHQSWTVFDRTGVLLGRFSLSGDPSSRRELAGFGPGYVVVRYRDEVGALHLAFYRELPSSDR